MDAVSGRRVEPPYRDRWAMAWAEHGGEVDEPKGRLRVAGWLYAKARPDGTGCLAAAQWLADLCHVSERTMRDVLKALRDEGWLVVQERGKYIGGKRRKKTATIYALQIPDSEPAKLCVSLPVREGERTGKLTQRTGKVERDFAVPFPEGRGDGLAAPSPSSERPDATNPDLRPARPDAQPTEEPKSSTAGVGLNGAAGTPNGHVPAELVMPLMRAAKAAGVALGPGDARALAAKHLTPEQIAALRMRDLDELIPRLLAHHRDSGTPAGDPAAPPKGTTT